MLPRRSWWKRGWLLAVALCLTATNGCGLLPRKTTSPEAQLRSLRQEHRGTPEGIIPTDLQAELMRFADRYATVLVQGVDDFTGRLGSPEARVLVQTFKADHASAAIFIASGPQALVSLLDMIVLVTSGRHWLNGPGRETARETVGPLLRAHGQLEIELWTLAERHLRPDQVVELRDLLRDWHERHPETPVPSFTRFADLAGAVAQKDPPKPESVLRLPQLDSLAGLEAVPRVTEQARFLAERAMYWAQRLPIVTQWRTELVAFHLSATPELRQTFFLTEQLTNTLAHLPALVGRERAAAIHQIFAELAVQQTNLAAHLAAQETQVGGLLTDVDRVLATGTGAATAGSQLVDSMRGLLGQPPIRELAGALTNVQPFDPREYGAMLTQVTASTRELNTLLQSAEWAVPKVLTHTVESGEAFTNHLVKLGLLLGVCLLAGLVAALFVYRLLARKFLGAP